MKKLTITVGMSGSGKSTWAHNQWKEDPKNTIIVNRDKIRELLYGYNEATISKYYHLDNLYAFEKQVTSYENVLIKEGLASGKHVIVDATHLEQRYIKRFKYFNVPITIQVFAELATTCNERDKKRNRSVGPEVILKQSKKMVKLLDNLADIDLATKPLVLDTSLPECIILDLDGTIAEKGDRSPYDYAKVGGDTVIASTFRLVEALSVVNNEYPNATKLIVCTGREGTAISKKESKQWCDDNDIFYEEFHMREEGDMRADWVVKEEMWRDISTRYNILGMFDDRNQVTDRARNLGLTVFHVAYHNF